MRAQRYEAIPGAHRSGPFEWVHVYAAAPVPPTGAGSFNYLLWEILQEHAPRHLLIARWYPDSHEAARRHGGVPVVHVRFRDRPSLSGRLKHALAATPLFGRHRFVREAAAIIAEADVRRIMVWGDMRLVPHLARALPDHVMVFAQRHFELPRTAARVFQHCDYLLTQTEGTTKSVFDQEYAIHATVVTIPNGVDLDTYRPPSGDERQSLRRRLGLPEDRCVFLFPSKLHGHKGVSYLHDWIRLCEREIPEAFFVVTGTPAESTGPIRRLTRFLESAPNARWLRGVHRDEMPIWYRASDVSLMPGVWREGMSMAALESLASGLPLVATTRGIYPEIVDHGRTGWLCRPEALLREGLGAIEVLARDAGLRRAMGENARAYAEKRLPRRRCLDSFGAFFEGRLLDIDADLSP